jgi:hypothetical protein
MDTYISNGGIDMPRVPDEGEPKQRYSVTLNQDLVERLTLECKIDNLSGWLNERVREAVLNNSVVLKCGCGCTASPHLWQRWLLICPTCKADHAKLDRRERIKLTGDNPPPSEPPLSQIPKVGKW